MKLELKHLAPYLPYGLTIKNIMDGSVIEMVADSELYKTPQKTELNGRIPIMVIFNSNTVKPILRPLSDFNKQIQFFEYPKNISLLEYINIAKTDEYTYHPKLNCLRLKTSYGYNQWNFKVNGQLGLPYLIVDLLFKNHFDVFGLINQGLAIDINTIKP